MFEHGGPPAENQAAGRRLAAIGELDAVPLRAVGERETWAIDTPELASTEVAAAPGVRPALATNYLYYSGAMRTQLSRAGAYPGRARCWRPLAVDARPALEIPRRPGMTQSRLAASVDWIVARTDRDALRRRQEQHPGRHFYIWDGGTGLAEVFGRLISNDAHAVDARLHALADFVRCRDLTCRFPGCEPPATRCAIHHSIPHADVGATHAFKLSALCRFASPSSMFGGIQGEHLGVGVLFRTSEVARFSGADRRGQGRGGGARLSGSHPWKCGSGARSALQRRRSPAIQNSV